MKGGAFLLAIMLWLVISLNQQTDSTFYNQIEDQLTIDNVQVEMIYDDELYAIVEAESRVQVSVSGRRALLNLNTLRQEPYRIYADLSDLGEGEHQVTLEHEGFPSELSVGINPRRIDVVLEEKDFRSFPVQSIMTGNVADGYTAGSPTISPDQVQVIAAKSVLEQVSMVRGYVNMNDATETVEQNLQLRIYDQNGNELDAEVSPGEVSVQVPVYSPSKRVPFNIDIVNDLPSGISFVSIESDVNEVEVFSSPNALDQITEVVKVVDLSDIDVSQTIDYEIPLGDGWNEVRPATVQVGINVGPTVERDFSDRQIDVQGLAEQYDLNFINPASGQISLSVYGSQSRINRLASSAVQVAIDVSQLDEGVHEVELDVQVPDHLSYSPESISIEIEIVNKEEDANEEIEATREG